MQVAESVSLMDLLSRSHVHWQPIADLSDGRIIGVEALFRPENSGPADVLAEIDRLNFWETFTTWEMGEILSDLETLSPSEVPLLVFFNLSPKQCVPEWILPHFPHFPDFVAPVAEVIEEKITKDEMERLKEIRKGGALIAIDDFGTGYSNVDRLLDLPVDFVKIDRKLIQTVTRFDRNLVESVVRGLGSIEMSILGEGIETEAQFLFARQIGCQTGQGWHFGKPMPIGKFGVLLASKGIHSAKWGLEPG